MSKIELINGSCADQEADVIVNAANGRLWAGGSLENPVGESTKQCCRAYKKFTDDYPDYDIDVKVCVFAAHEVSNAQAEFNNYI